jgi:hypothetical protein
MHAYITYLHTHGREIRKRACLRTNTLYLHDFDFLVCRRNSNHGCAAKIFELMHEFLDTIKYRNVNDKIPSEQYFRPQSFCGPPIPCLHPPKIN